MVLFRRTLVAFSLSAVALLGTGTALATGAEPPAAVSSDTGSELESVTESPRPESPSDVASRSSGSPTPSSAPSPAAAAIPSTERAPAAPDVDCAQFATRHEAQAVLDADRSDPNGLDRDKDGMACEALPAMASTSTPAPEPTATSEQVRRKPRGGVATGGFAFLR